MSSDHLAAQGTRIVTVFFKGNNVTEVVANDLCQRSQNRVTNEKVLMQHLTICWPEAVVRILFTRAGSTFYLGLIGQQKMKCVSEALAHNRYSPQFTIKHSGRHHNQEDEDNQRPCTITLPFIKTFLIPLRRFCHLLASRFTFSYLHYTAETILS